MALTKVSSSLIKDNTITADHLNVVGHGPVGAMLTAKGDGSFEWDTSSVPLTVLSIAVGQPPVSLNTIEKLANSLNNDEDFFNTISGLVGGLQNDIDALETRDPVLTINGDASGTATFTNLGDATLTLTIADDSHNHIISNIDGLQSALDLKADITYVDTAVANLVDSSPSTLDTLNELAAALGDDPNFATTVTNLIAGKQDAGTYNTIIGTDTDIDTSGATIVDNIYVTDGVITSMGTRTLTLGDLGYTGATNANYITNNNQLTNGAGYITSFDITTQTDSKYLRSNADDTASGVITLSKNTQYPLILGVGSQGGNIGVQFSGHGTQTGYMYATHVDASSVGANYSFHFSSTEPNTNVIIDGSGNFIANGSNPVWHSGNDGSGSGLDADLLDGQHASAFVNVSGDTMTGTLVAPRVDANDVYINSSSGQISRISNENNLTIYSDHIIDFKESDANVLRAQFGLNGAGNFSFGGEIDTSYRLRVRGNMRIDSDVRATIFYDLDNTAYYTSPAGLTVLSDLAVRLSGDVGHSRIQIGDIPNGTGGRIFTSDNRYRLLSSVNLYDTGSTSWGRDVSAGAAAVNLILSNTTSGTGRIIFLADASGTAYPETQMTVFGEGYVAANGSFRAPIFYDSNNTARYLNPAGDSSLQNINMNNGTLSNLNNLTFNDPGPNEGIEWIGGNGWKIFESPDNLTTNTGGNLQFVTGSTRRMTIDTSGNVFALGSSRAPIFYDSNNTSYYLHPDSTSRLNSSTSNYINLASAAAYSLRFWGGSHNYSIRMSQSADATYGGRVGGETTSDYNMYFTMAAGTNRGFVFNNGLANAIAGIDASGNGRFEGDVIAFSASDKRLKDNIKPIENALDKVNKISGVEFDWNSNQDTYAEGMHDIGVIAQEIEEVIPEVVKTRDNGYKAVKYEKIVPLLIEAIKEQQTQIDELKQLINKQ